MSIRDETWNVCGDVIECLQDGRPVCEISPHVAGSTRARAIAHIPYMLRAIERIAERHRDNPETVEDVVGILGKIRG